jgi:hypothetical protein
VEIWTIENGSAARVDAAARPGVDGKRPAARFGPPGGAPTWNARRYAFHVALGPLVEDSYWFVVDLGG